jgi:hypothetical protein
MLAQLLCGHPNDLFALQITQAFDVPGNKSTHSLGINNQAIPIGFGN